MNTDTAISIRNLGLHFGPKYVLKDVSFDIPPRAVTAIMGPSGCGKSTLLRCINRMNDLILSCRITGQVIIDGIDIYSETNKVDVIDLRKRVGMVFQKPNPFPKSIFENIAFGLRIHGVRDRNEIRARVERSLRQANLWDEVQDRLTDSAFSLSGGQQQRLCLARAMAVNPGIILLDEPASALDPHSTARLEELVIELKKEYTIVIVTHNMQQAARVSDHCAFIMLGELAEWGQTEQVFTTPKDKRTEDFLTGKFG